MAVGHRRRAGLRARAGRRGRLDARPARARPRVGGGDRAGLRGRRGARAGRRRLGRSRAPGVALAVGAGAPTRGSRWPPSACSTSATRSSRSWPARSAAAPSCCSPCWSSATSAGSRAPAAPPWRCGSVRSRPPRLPPVRARAAPPARRRGRDPDARRAGDRGRPRRCGPRRAARGAGRGGHRRHPGRARRARAPTRPGARRRPPRCRGERTGARRRARRRRCCASRSSTRSCPPGRGSSRPSSSTATASRATRCARRCGRWPTRASSRSGRIAGPASRAWTPMRSSPSTSCAPPWRWRPPTSRWPARRRLPAAPSTTPPRCLARACRRARPRWSTVSRAHADLHTALVRAARSPRIEAVHDRLTRPDAPLPPARPPALHVRPPGPGAPRSSLADLEATAPSRCAAPARVGRRASSTGCCTAGPERRCARDCAGPPRVVHCAHGPRRPAASPIARRRRRRARPHRWWTLGAVCVATFMLLLDITIVNVAMPDDPPRPQGRPSRTCSGSSTPTR